MDLNQPIWGMSKKAPVPGRCMVRRGGQVLEPTEGAWGRPVTWRPPKAMPCPFCADLAEIMHQIEAQTREEAWGRWGRICGSVLRLWLPRAGSGVGD